MADDATKPFALLAFPKSETPWTNGAELVQAFLDNIRSGEIQPDKVMILWFSRTDGGGLRPHRWYQNMTTSEEIALLEVAKTLAIEEWKDE